MVRDGSGRLDAGALRPIELAPRPLPRSRWEAAGDVVRRRREELGARAPALGVEDSGRLLLHLPDAALWDGAPELASRGFFDVHGAPPHGTWSAWFEEDRPGRTPFESYLLAWVPAAWVSLANEGLLVAADDCLVWLAEADATIRRIFEQFGWR